jgi:exodeoxyribonuclease V
MLSDRQPDKGLFASDSLLQHLFEYVYSGQNCSLLLIGDTAQLAPVAETQSIALDEQQLALRFELTPFTALLTEVVRQAAESAILSNATRIRDSLIANDFQFKLDTTSGSEVFRMQDGSELLEALEDAYREAGMQETAIIVRSNKRANLYNKNIRQRILQLDNELSAGDILMVVKNNYYWLSESKEVAFIANGDAIEVLQIYQFKTLYDFKFAEVQVQLLDYESPPFDAVLLLDVLEADQPALSFEDGNKLYQKVAEDYAHESSKYKRYLGIKNNRYFNALQVKYSYAITCHKAQGGQWRRIFVEKPYAPDGLDQDHLKWLYTAFTRASERLYLMGFENDYFYENEIR